MLLTLQNFRYNNLSVMVLIEMIIEITIDFQYNSVNVSFAHLADNWDYSWSDFITHGFFLIGLSRFLYFGLTREL